MPPLAPKTEQFQGIQALRYIAALLVVINHSTFYVASRLVEGFPIWGQGSSGVDIFFVISGFVMIISSQGLAGQDHPARSFLLNRIVRIVPLYWMITTLKLAVLLSAPNLALNSEIIPYHVLMSYLFIPAFNAKGELEPLLGVGWTLNFEMFFYVIFALALALKRSPIKFSLPIFIVLSVIGFWKTPEWPALTFWLNPLVLEFLAGMLIARACLNGLALPKGIAVAAVVIGFALLLTDFGYFDPWYRGFRYGIPAALIVAGAVSLESVLKQRIPAFMSRLGDGSYALYLIHPILVPAIPAVFAKVGLQMPILAVVLCAIAATLASYVVFMLVERPLTRYLKSKLQGPRPVAASVPLR